jgi:serine/threonine protein kinase
MQFREITDRYQLEKILKSNRFGTVLRARDTASGRTVAVKLITVTSPPRLTAGAPEFERLAATLTGLRVPSLPAVLDSGFTSDGSAFLAMELLEGQGLDSFHGVPPDLVLARIGQALDGLVALAAQGFAHLNLSPDNLFVTGAVDGGGVERVTLLGLGTAIFRPRGAEAVGAASSENARFQAPEVAAGAAPANGADSRADLYSLALTACHALGATVGFGESPVVQLPLAVSFELANDEALRQALEGALRQRPEERPSIRELREALRLAIGAPAASAPVAAVTAVAAAPAVLQAARPAPVQPAIQTVPPVQPPIQAVPPPPFLSAGAPPPAAPLASAAPMASLTAAAPLPAIQPSAPPAPPPAAVPPATPPDEPRDVLSSVDDELLNSMIAPPPPARPAAAAGRPQTGARVVPFTKKAPAPPAAPAGGPARRDSWLRKPVVLAALAGGVVLALLAGYWLLQRHRDAVAEVQAVPAAGLRQPFTQPPTDRLEEAKLDLAQGDDLKAQHALRSIAWGEQGLLPPAGCRTLGAIQENLALAAFERLPADLESGLKSGNLEVLESAVEAGAGQQAALAPEVHAEYDRAKSAVDAYIQVRAASAQGNPAQTLERFAALAALLPKPSDPDDLRGKAATAIEGESEKLVRDGRYADAVTALAPLQRAWPDRSGLKERAARYETYQRNEAQQERILAELPVLERHKKPWDGLQMLKGVEPTPHLAAQFQEARGRLEDLLARLDKEPPVLVLRDGFALDYSRGTMVNLSFRATDDYQVRDVKMMARPEGGKYREIPLDKTRTGYYTVVIPPSFHQNGTVDFYVVATDLSGHETSLGSRDQPMQLKRQQGFDRILH